MKKVFVGIFGLIILVCLVLYINIDKQDFYGTYNFEEVTYLSPISSSFIGHVNEQMAETRYTIKSDLFKIDSKYNGVEIISPIYVKVEIDNNSYIYPISILDSKEVNEQYNIFYEDGSATDLRLYVSSDSLWIASYVPIASPIVIGSSGSEMIVSIYKLSK